MHCFRKSREKREFNDDGKMTIQADDQEGYIVFRNPSCVTYTVINVSVEPRGPSEEESICLLTAHTGPGGLPKSLPLLLVE